jgi:hypothetical protein
LTTTVEATGSTSATRVTTGELLATSSGESTSGSVVSYATALVASVQTVMMLVLGSFLL